jgi:outer membrane protein
MKQVILFLSIGIFILILYGFETTKNKYGFINATEVIASMPESKEIEVSLNKYKGELETQLKSMQDEFKVKSETYQKKAETLSPLVKQEQEKQINTLKTNIDEFITKANTDLNNRKQELLAEVVKKFKKAVDEVANEGGYRQIIDNSSGILLFTSPADDIRVGVEKKLGIKK